MTIIEQFSHVTLHYRLSVVGEVLADFLSTFEGKPATVTVGQAQLAPFIENALLGLKEGEHQIFDISAQDGFGPRNEDLVQTLSKAVVLQFNPHAKSFQKAILWNLKCPINIGYQAV